MSLESDFTEPLVNLTVLLVQALATHLLRYDADAVLVLAIGSGLHDVVQRIIFGCVGGAERDDGLALQVVQLQEGEYGHGAVYHQTGTQTNTTSY